MDRQRLWQAMPVKKSKAADQGLTAPPVWHIASQCFQHEFDPPPSPQVTDIGMQEDSPRAFEALSIILQIRLYLN